MKGRRLLKVTKVHLKDTQNTVYIFTRQKDVIINGVPRGKGSLITPICQLTISRKVCFTLEGKKLQTGPLLSLIHI